MSSYFTRQVSCPYCNAKRTITIPSERGALLYQVAVCCSAIEHGPCVDRPFVVEIETVTTLKAMPVTGVTLPEGEK